jgi:hypothetical protein
MEQGLKDPDNDRESDYWSKLRKYIATGLLDLELFVKLVSDSQLEEVFKPMIKEDRLDIHLIGGLRYAKQYKKKLRSPKLNGKYNRTDLISILELALNPSFSNPALNTVVMSGSSSTMRRLTVVRPHKEN